MTVPISFVVTTLRAACRACQTSCLVCRHVICCLLSAIQCTAVVHVKELHDAEHLLLTLLDWLACSRGTQGELGSHHGYFWLARVAA